MSDFAKVSNFDRNANFHNVKFGADAPLLEVELNELQDIQNELRADIVRDSIPSGFINISDLDYTTMATTPNTIKLLTDSIAYVNGYKITIPSGTTIPLSAPPTTGTREDILFLEVWKEEIDYTKTIPTGGKDDGVALTNNIKDTRVGVETSRRYQLKWRIRVVDGVDINKLPIDGMANINCYYSGNGEYYGITPQGGNPTPIVADSSTSDSRVNTLYRNSTHTPSPSYTFFNRDLGLYTCGFGSDSSKSILKTVDGYVYAIPMFKVHRRNTGACSVNNANGGRIYCPRITITYASAYYLGATTTITAYSGSIALLNVGDILSYNGVNRFKVLSVGTTTASVLCIGSVSSGATLPFNVISGRADGLYSDIVYDRDILDYRHIVSLTGFNYNQLMEDNFDKLLRGELQTKERTKMLKTYHGVSKTPIDANTVFNASLDGKVSAELGGYITTIENIYTQEFSKMPTGLGWVGASSNVHKVIEINNLTSNSGTVDFWIDREKTGVSSWKNNASCLFQLNNINGFRAVDCYVNNSGVVTTEVHIAENSPVGNKIVTYPMSSSDGKFVHIRFTWTLNGEIRLYVNGKLKSTATYTTPFLTPKSLIVGNGDANGVTTHNIFPLKGVIADVSVSNIDRGAVFATLPQDFIDGYAQVMASFNEQRKTQSDAITSEYVNIKVSGNKSNYNSSNGVCYTNRSISVTGANMGTFDVGNTLQIKGLSRELIGGVIDTDTVLGMIVKEAVSPVTVLYMDDVSKFAVNDTIVVANVNSNGTINGVSNTATISAIDTVNKTITLSVALNSGPSWTISFANGTFVVVENTTSTSTPTVKFNYNGVLTNVVGTWSGLGSDVATFTFGDNTYNEEYLNGEEYVQVEYSLIEPNGQGGIAEVLVNTLSGESNGKKLMCPSYTLPHITDDFLGKIYGSIVINPNIYRKTNLNSTPTTLMTPTSFASYNGEAIQSSIDTITTMDGVTTTSSTNINGAIAQQLFSFNLVSIFESKYGTIPGINLVDKITWLKNNLTKVICSWWGYGTCPSGNKADMNVWSNNAWSKVRTSTSEVIATTFGSSSDISANSYGALNLMIDTNGFIHFLVSTDASNGTINSVINTDYVSLEITVKTPSGYDILIPENPRRDDGLTNIILVRKETREVVALLGSPNNTSGIITYGDYIPCSSISINQLYSIKYPSDLLANSLMATTYGTGKYVANLIGTGLYPVGYQTYRNSLYNLLGPDSIINLSDYTLEELDNSSTYSNNGKAHYRKWINPTIGFNDNNFKGALSSDIVLKANNFVLVIILLYKVNGAIKLGMFIDYYKGGKIVGEVINYVDLTNRPLIR